MLKYLSAAVALKLFSLNSATRSGYRYLGNLVGQKKRGQQDINEYVTRGDLLVDLARKYGLLENDAAVVELGTGWIHWFGLYLSMHAQGDLQLELFDVWDNRQLDALKQSFSKLADRWEQENNTDTRRREALDAIQDAASFEELYERFNAHYTISSEGSLAGYPAATYNAVISFHVLEHIGRGFIENSIGDMYRMLKPGGYCIHQIGIDDHLAHYDSRVSKKHYLSYSLSKRKYLFENVVQYHNVLQGEDYQRFFRDAGFEILETDRERCDIENLRIHPEWEGYSREDQETTILTLVCRKPL